MKTALSSLSQRAFRMESVSTCEEGANCQPGVKERVATSVLTASKTVFTSSRRGSSRDERET